MRYLNIWRFPETGVPPNHPFLVGCSFINHPFWGTPFMETPIYVSTFPNLFWITTNTVRLGACQRVYLPKPHEFPNFPWYLQNLLILRTIGLRCRTLRRSVDFEVAALPSRLLAFLPHGQGWSLGTYGNRNLEPSPCWLWTMSTWWLIPPSK